MPKLWSNTIEAHRAAVREAALDATGALVAEHGLRSVTMSQIAEKTGIGRATLYKYFPDMEAILRAWHARRVAGHFERLVQVRDQPGGAGERLVAVLEEYALIVHETHKSQGKYDSDFVAFLHRDEQVSRSRQQLHDLVTDLLAEAATAGDVRDDIPPGELTVYCLQALTAAGRMSTKTAVRRLIAVTLAGLRRP